MVYLMKKQLNLDFLLSEVIDLEASFEHLRFYSYIHTLYSHGWDIKNEYN